MGIRLAFGMLLCWWAMVGCSETDDPDDHVLSTQTRALDEAREVENTLNAADQTRRRQID